MKGPEAVAGGTQWQVLTVAELFSRVTSTGLDPVVLIGAGASVKSGIPSSSDIVRLAMRWLYAHKMGWQPDDPRIAPSDVSRMLEEHAWYLPGVDLGEYFANAMELIDQPRELRRRFLLHVLGQATNPSAGYEHLATLLRHRAILTVLTTNFDDLIKVAYGPGALIIVAKPDEYQAISTAPPYPQAIYLHGQAEYYMDRNLRTEVDHLDPDLVERLLPLIRDHPVVVVGYRGAELSVMRDLFLANVERTGSFKNGVYWCIRGQGAPSADDAHQLITQLAERIGSNFAFVPILDFDRFFAELRSRQEEAWRHRVPRDSERSPVAASAAASTLPFDLRPARSSMAEDLDWEWVRRLLQTYASRLAHDLPSEMPRQWCEAQMVDAGLAVRDGAGIRLTNGGILLLTKEPRRVAPGAYVEVRLPGRPPRAVDGTVWEQYEAALALLQQANRPIRVKGTRSETIRPYPDEALKEVLANALIHRDYERPEPVVIFVSPQAIRIDSPGGLEEGLVRRLLGGTYEYSTLLRIPRDILQRRVEHGERGRILTAYRNRVLADLFFGTGIVDKAGSGLADALEAMEEVGGRLRAEISEDNSDFMLTLVRRPLRVDDRTRTARAMKPSEYVHTNLFEVIQLPSVVWSAASLVRRPPDPQLDLSTRDWPRFVSYGSCLYTFSDLRDPENPLRPTLIDASKISAIEIGTFAAGHDGQRRLVHLLHEVLFHRLERVGLRTDWSRKRAYYACTRGGARYVQYHGQVHREKRRVAWWPGKERTYCVHKAAQFHFERYGEHWALRIVPTYVFTRDGAKDRIQGREATSLATKFSTEDYNPKVRADIFFWRAVLAEGGQHIALGAKPGGIVVLAAQPTGAILTPASADNAETTSDTKDLQSSKTGGRT